MGSDVQDLVTPNGYFASTGAYKTCKNTQGSKGHFSV